MDVKRYDPYFISDQGYRVGADMALESLGDWVRGDDFDAVAKERDDLKEKVEFVARELRAILFMVTRQEAK